MRLFIFESNAKTGLRAFVGDVAGRNLPDQFSTWRQIGAVRPGTLLLTISVSSIVTLGIQASGNVGLSRSSAMSRLCLSLTVAAFAASLTCGVALAQYTAPNPALKTQASSEPSTAAKVENWTKKQWNAAKQKWSQDKAKWKACNQDSKDQELSGRKSWSYLYDCMTKA